MKLFHVKNGMKKALAVSLAAAMVVPSAVMTGTLKASAAPSNPDPAKYITFEKGFVADGVKQTKFGAMIGFCEGKFQTGQYRGLGYFNLTTGRLTNQYTEEDVVLVEGSFNSDYKNKAFNSNGVFEDDTWFKGYKRTKVPAGAKKQYVPDIKTDNGNFLAMNAAWNQPTTVYDEEKGMVFWLDDTLENESYPTYATTVDYEAGTWTTDDKVLFHDGVDKAYMEFDINNSAAEFDNPFVNGATGLTFSAWIKNTQPYKAPQTLSVLGDLDGNGAIDINDALSVLKHIAKISVLSNGAVKFADVDGSGQTDINDALAILKYVAKIVTEFEGETPEPVAIGVSEQEDSEFFHVEKRAMKKGDDGKVIEDDKSLSHNLAQREYLYFSGNGVTYVGDWSDPESVCVWELDETLKEDETVNLLNGKNGQKWVYVSYTFDGTNFHMYLNGKEAKLNPTAGANYQNKILDLIKDKDASTYLGGRGGGVKDNFNTYAIKTSNDYYMDDIAVYTSALSQDDLTKAYTAAKKEMDDAKAKKYSLLKTYSFEGADLAADSLTAVEGAKTDRLPTANTDGKKGKAIKLNKGSQSEHGGVQLTENPFAGKKDLTGMTISYWLKSVPSRGSVVTDGPLISFIDDPHPCVHDKVGANYQGEEGIAKSQLYLNQAMIGQFVEGITKPVGTQSLKNIYTYKPYPFGDPEGADMKPGGTNWWKRQFEMYNATDSYYNDWKKNFRDGMATEWHFVTVTFNNAGFVMYLDGEEVKNRATDSYGPRFCDYSIGRQISMSDGITRKETNNGGARSLMDFMTADDTKVYIGFAYQGGNDTSFYTATECYLDELSFYDKDMTAAEVKALYSSVK